MSSYCNGDKPHEHLRPFGPTLVLFHQDDPLGMLMAWITLMPFGILCSYFSLLVTSKSAWVGLALTGQIISEVINYTLKKYIQIRRPHST